MDFTIMFIEGVKARKETKKKSEKLSLHFHNNATAVIEENRKRERGAILVYFCRRQWRKKNVRFQILGKKLSLR